MARLDNLKRIIKEDFPEENQDLVDKLAYVINPFLEQISNAFNKNINIDNLSRQIVSIEIENASGPTSYTVNGENVGGLPKTQTQFKVNLTNRIQGLNIIKAENLTNPGVYPVNSPFISWVINTNIITVKKVTGIQDNNKYRLTLEIIS